MENVRKISKKYYLRQIICCWLVFYMLFCFGIPVQVVMADLTPPANALPSGIIDSTGINTPVISGLNMDITQTLGEAIINWNNFDIGSDAGVEFFQPGSAAAVLNRVHDGDVTGIMGSLTANGRVFVINPAGIVFGEGAVVNVSQLVASSLKLDDADFLDGAPYEFAGGSGMVSNYGQISAEQVALIGRKVLNAGVIQAPAGTVIMAAGDKVLLGYEGSDVVVEVTGVTLPEATDAEFKDGDVINEGTIEAAGGRIVLAAGDTWSRAIDGLDGLAVAVDGGTGRVGQFGTINVDGVEGDAGSITLTAGDVVALSSDSITTANAGTNGDGGEVIAYSPKTAIFRDGAIVEAKGGSESGDGGFFELSGKKYVETFGQIDLTAPYGATGDFLIDPRNIKIVDEWWQPNQGTFWTADPWQPWFSTGGRDYSMLDIDWLEWYLYWSNVTITTAQWGNDPGQAGWVEFDAGRDLVSERNWNWLWRLLPPFIPAHSTSNNSLTVNADNYIKFYSGSGINFTGSGSVTLNAGSSIFVNDGITLAGGNLNLNSGYNILVADGINLLGAHDLTAEALHGIQLGGNVQTSGDIKLLADIDTRWGHDVVAKGLIDAGGKLEVEGTNINLMQGASSGDDMTLYAHGLYDDDPMGSEPLVGSGDVVVGGQLNASGKIEITATDFEPGGATSGPSFEGSTVPYSADGTIYLHANVDADDDIILNNNTWVEDDVLLKAGDNVETYGTLTGAGDLTVKAGDNILFGDDADDYVLVEDTLIAKSGLDWFWLIPSWSEGSIEAAGDVTAGDMLLSAGAGLPGFSDSHVSVAGNLTTTARRNGDMVVEAHHDITLSGDVDSAGDLTLNADRHDNWPYLTPDHMLGGDVLTEGTVDADGTIDMYGNNITLEEDVTSGGDMTLTADTSHEFPPSEPQGDVVAQGNLESTGGNIDIYADDDTIHLENDYVKAHDTITLHNNTVADDGVLIKAGDNVETYGTLTGAGDLTVEAGDNILFGDDAGDYVLVEDSLVARAGLDIPSSWCPPCWSEGFIEAAGDITAADMLLTAGWGWPGYEVSTPTQTYVHVAGMLTSTAGDITVGAQHDIRLGGKDVDGTWTSVDAAGNLTLDGDWHSPLYGDGYKGGDVEVAGTVDAGGTIDMYGNNITLHQNVTSGGNMTLTADTSSDFEDTLPEGDVVAMGNLTSTGGSVSIYSSDDTTYLGGDVTAFVDVLLNNNTEFTSTDDQHVTAQTGSVTANGYLEKPEDGSLYLLANDDISLKEHVTVENGGISIIAETGKIFTPGAGGALNVDISGTSDHVLGIGVDLPKDYDQPAPAAAGEYETGKAAIVIMSEKALTLGPDGVLTAKGTYYTYDDDVFVDDRPGVDFANYDRPGKPGGDPIDVAIYLASNSREPIDLLTFDFEGDVHVGSPVTDLPDGAVMVVDAYDMVTFGDAFETSLDNGNVDWLEVCSRISPTYEFAWAYNKLPKSAGEGWDLDNYVWRGEGGGDDGGAWVLEPAPTAPLAQFQTPTIEGCPVETEAAAMELGITAETIQVGIGNALALNPTIQPCEACAALVDAAGILRDEDGSRMAAMVQTFNVLAPSDAPFTPEMVTSIAMAFEGAAEGSQYASAMEYIDAFVQYVAVLDIELGSPVGDGDSVAFVMEKYGAGITESDNANIAVFVAAQLEAFGG